MHSTAREENLSQQAELEESVAASMAHLISRSPFFSALQRSGLSIVLILVNFHARLDFPYF
jgi:hypothetical protein